LPILKKWPNLAYSVVKKNFQAPFLLKKMEKSTFGGLFDCKIVVLGLVGLQGKIILVLGHCCYQK
jgi:hypothetical protein